ncbi:MAG TPA: hypothetical protein VNO31_05680 [Umezawaea sp.]|nr:hypothetical protein [Umezawaea sp.]
MARRPEVFVRPLSMEDGRTSPADRGITAFVTWSLSKPREHLLAALDLLTAMRHR